MPELELTRTRGDRRLFAIGGVGTLRLGGMWSRGGTAEAGQSCWRLHRHGLLKADRAGARRGGQRRGRLEWPRRAGRQPTAAAPTPRGRRCALGNDRDSTAVASTKIAEHHRHASSPCHWYSTPDRTVPVRRPPALAM